MKIKDIFDLEVGKPHELINMTTNDSKINFVSRTSENNGVIAMVDELEGSEPYSAGYITVALGGSVLSAFVQTHAFYTAFHIMVLIPKKKMTFLEKLYYCHVINYNKYKYNYGRQANKTLSDIEIPDRIPSWALNIDLGVYERKISTNISKKLEYLNTNEWKEFILKDFFELVNGVKYPTEYRKKGNIPLVSTTSNNNGISDYIEYRKEVYENILTVAYSGSVGEVFYHESPVFIGETVFGLIPKFKFNKNIAMFLIPIIRLNNKRYSYGRKIIGSKYLYDLIRLPVDKSGKVDWEFMEYYIKQLPYSDRI